MKKWKLILPLPLVAIVVIMAIVPYNPGPPEGDRVPFAKVTNVFLGDGMSFQYNNKTCVGWTMIIFTGYADRVYSIQTSDDQGNIYWDEIAKYKDSSAVIHNDPIYKNQQLKVYRVTEIKK